MADIEIIQQKQSHTLRNIFLIIIIALLIWQYILPMFMVIKTPSEYISEIINPDYSTSVYTTFLKNDISGVTTDITLPFTEYYMTNLTLYRLGITIESPYALIGDYTWSFHIQVLNKTTNVWSDIIPVAIRIHNYQLLYSNTFYLPETALIIAYDNTYSLSMTLYAPDGSTVLSSSNQNSQWLILWKGGTTP